MELFFERKIELSEKIDELMKELKAKHNIQVKKIQCSNAS